MNAGLDQPIDAATSRQCWCGTERLGRDLYSRTLAGITTCGLTWFWIAFYLYDARFRLRRA